MAKFISLDNLTRAINVLKIGFSSSTAKTTLVDADSFLMIDSADTETVNGVANVKKRKQITWANFKVELGNFFAAADAMVFKGTIGTAGTVTALPTTHQIGWTYRVITAGTYLGHVCEIGDLIIAIIDRAGSGNVTGDWTVAQANADLSGIPLAADTNPLMDGVVSIGISTKYARQDHVHASDTSKLAASHAGTGGAAHADVVAGSASGFMTGALATKLNGIEAAADVTDAANVGAINWAATAKATPLDADTFPISDTAASNGIKKVTFTAFKAFLKTYFDTLYATAAHAHTTFDRATSVLTGATVFSDIVVLDGIVTAISTRAITLGDLGAAAASHAHGNILAGGNVGTTADLPLVTSAGGVVIAGAFASDAEIDAIVV